MDECVAAPVTDSLENLYRLPDTGMADSSAVSNVYHQWQSDYVSMTKFDHVAFWHQTTLASAWVLRWSTDQDCCFLSSLKTWYSRLTRLDREISPYLFEAVVVTENTRSISESSALNREGFDSEAFMPPSSVFLMFLSLKPCIEALLIESSIEICCGSSRNAD